jgi:two-component system OmpR family sensor kinase
MFRSLNTRLLISYVSVILVCLVLVGIGLLLFVRASPLWNDASFRQLEAALRDSLPTLREAGPAETLSLQQTRDLMNRVADEQNVRVLLMNPQGNVLIDTEGDWEGEQLVEVARPLNASERTPRGTFTGPNGGRWDYVMQTLRGPNNRTLLMAYITRHSRLLALLWFASNLLPPLLQAGAVALVLSVLLALLVSRSVSKPLRRVADAARAITRGQTGIRAPVSGPNEVRGLARSFNTMVEQVEAVQQSQRDFVANVSHELKTPLTSIQGFSQALLDGTAATPEATARAARVIHEETERMRRMVDDLLTLARFDAGQMVMAREPVELGPLLSSCVEKLAPQAQAAHVTVELDASEKVTVPGDADRLAQVLTNLVDNSIAHTPQGGKVTLAVHRSAESSVEIAVTDSGEGIPAEEISRVFERFYQVDKSRPRRRGAGLGLAIVKEIVEAHGGTIVAESVVGLGSRFTVRLPAKQAE